MEHLKNELLPLWPILTVLVGIVFGAATVIATMTMRFKGHDARLDNHSERISVLEVESKKNMAILGQMQEAVKNVTHSVDSMCVKIDKIDDKIDKIMIDGCAKRCV